MTAKDIFKKSLWLIAILLCVLPEPGRTAGMADIQKEAAKITSISARFTQSKHMNMLAKPLISQGRFYFRAPDSIRWEYTTPVRSILIMNRGEIRRYTVGSRGLAEDTTGALQSMQAVLREIGQWSLGRFTENDHFSATLEEGKNPKVVLLPKEKGMAKMISRIVLALSSDRPGLMETVTIYEDDNNYTLFSFTDVITNLPLDESLFRKAQ